ncbi:hypothetical protein WA158_001363 [Blastocystis sp. Blastoise]
MTHSIQIQSITYSLYIGGVKTYKVFQGTMYYTKTNDSTHLSPVCSFGLHQIANLLLILLLYCNKNNRGDNEKNNQENNSNTKSLPPRLFKVCVEDGEVIGCTCGKGDTEGSSMLDCDLCRRWYHCMCVGLDPLCTRTRPFKIRHGTEKIVRWLYKWRISVSKNSQQPQSSNSLDNSTLPYLNMNNLHGNEENNDISLYQFNTFYHARQFYIYTWLSQKDIWVKKQELVPRLFKKHKMPLPSLPSCLLSLSLFSFFLLYSHHSLSISINSSNVHSSTGFEHKLPFIQL